jgi:hypothetical protein
VRIIILSFQLWELSRFMKFACKRGGNTGSMAVAKGKKEEKATHQITSRSTSSKAEDEVESWLLANSVVGKSTAIFELLAGENQALLAWRNTLPVLNFGLDVLDGLQRLNLKSALRERKETRVSLRRRRRGKGRRATNCLPLQSHHKHLKPILLISYNLNCTTQPSTVTHLRPSPSLIKSSTVPSSTTTFERAETWVVV